MAKATVARPASSGHFAINDLASSNSDQHRVKPQTRQNFAEKRAPCHAAYNPLGLCVRTRVGQNLSAVEDTEFSNMSRSTLEKSNRIPARSFAPPLLSCRPPSHWPWYVHSGVAARQGALWLQRGVWPSLVDLRDRNDCFAWSYVVNEQGQLPPSLTWSWG